MTLLEEEYEALQSFSNLDTLNIKNKETSHKMNNMILSVWLKFNIKTPKKDYLFMFP